MNALKKTAKIIPEREAFFNHQIVNPFHMMNDKYGRRKPNEPGYFSGYRTSSRSTIRRGIIANINIRPEPHEYQAGVSNNPVSTDRKNNLLVGM
jgi:hypothetical protein